MEYFLERVVIKPPPIKRAAYSDRTSWLLAEFSRLVYEELPQEKSVKNLVSDIKGLAAAGKFNGELERLLADLIERSGREQSYAEAVLEKNNILYVDSFVKGNTEALLAEISSADESFLVLSNGVR